MDDDNDDMLKTKNDDYCWCFKQNSMVEKSCWWEKQKNLFLRKKEVMTYVILFVEDESCVLVSIFSSLHSILLWGSCIFEDMKKVVIVFWDIILCLPAILSLFALFFYIVKTRIFYVPQNSVFWGSGWSSGVVWGWRGKCVYVDIF